MLLINDLSLKITDSFSLQDISLSVKKAEVLVVFGNNGSGKTVLGKVIAGEIAACNHCIAVDPGVQSIFVEQQDNFFSQSSMRQTYYSQRYENIDQDGIPSVQHYLAGAGSDVRVAGVISLLKLEQVFYQNILSLSNGERKRVQLAYVLLRNPSLLVVDNPFVGLDDESMSIVLGLFELMKSNGCAIVLICGVSDIPSYADRVMELHEGKIIQYVALSDFKKAEVVKQKHIQFNASLFGCNKDALQNEGSVVEMNDVTVRLGGKKILDSVQLTIQANEKWLLSGHNGAGKTTLLSLITGDNPQAYNNNIVLFGKRRGSGESIWDIKRKIGFVSPELHLYFLRKNKLTAFRTAYYSNKLTCLQTVLSGFRDEVGFLSKPTAAEKALAQDWLHALGFSCFSNRQFASVSMGEQRFFLLLRALVKQPLLLVLDEPCQGLDPGQVAQFNELLSAICYSVHCTLLYVTHVMHERPSCINKHVVLENGRIVCCGDLVV